MLWVKKKKNHCILVPSFFYFVQSLISYKVDTDSPVYSFPLTVTVFLFAFLVFRKVLHLPAFLIVEVSLSDNYT